MTTVTAATSADPGSTPLLQVRNLVKHFPVRGGGLIARAKGEIHAVCDISFDLRAGETLGLVGESGCGKSTSARALLNLQPATSGQIIFDGHDVTAASKKTMRAVRKDMQIVFQDPFASLDPRMTVYDILAEPLSIHRLHAKTRASKIGEALQAVGLEPRDANRFPHEFSGGQRQRIGIARALILEPKVLILDEPVSALDVSIQAEIINLLETLQERNGLAYVFISHDLSVVRHICDRIAVMYLGRIVEIADADDLFVRPAHPYTQALISAIPVPDPRIERSRNRIVLQGDVPSPASPPSGCRFRTRCPKFAQKLTVEEQQKCINSDPDLADRGTGHATACHFAEATFVD